MARLLPLAFALLAPGCVPVTEPIGDIDKAKPDERLIGTWKVGEETWVVDRPEVKGNPKALMRARVYPRGGEPGKDKPDPVLWFFTATVGKRTYGNVFIDRDPKSEKYLDASQEGAYAKWAKGDSHPCWVGLLRIGGDAVALDAGSDAALRSVMKKENIDQVGGFYETRPGWLAKYLEKNGPASIFNAGDEAPVLKRAKK